MMERHQFSIDIDCTHCGRSLSDIVSEKQAQLTRAAAILYELVRQYDAMPDGELGRGLTNRPFLAARKWCQEMIQ